MGANDTSPSDSKNFSQKIWIAAGILLIVVILFILFKTLFSVLLLALAGILIAVYLRGCANILHRYLHWSRKLCVFLSVFLNILLLAGFFWFVGARLQQQIAVLSDKLPETIQHAKDQLNKSTIGSKALDYLERSGNTLKTRDVMKRLFSSSFGIVSDLYIVLLMGIFFTADPMLYKRGIIHLLPPKAKDKGDQLLDKFVTVLKKWLKGQIIGFFFIAIFTGIGLWIMGMPLILTLALIAGVLNFIPNFGPIIALIPAALLASLQGINTVIIIVCMYTFIQIVQSAVTQPIIQKKMVNLPPALVIFGQVAFGMVGGLWGVLLTSPIIAILMTTVNQLYVKEQSYHKYKVKEEG